MNLGRYSRYYVTSGEGGGEKEGGSEEDDAEEGEKKEENTSEEEGEAEKDYGDDGEHLGLEMLPVARHHAIAPVNIPEDFPEVPVLPVSRNPVFPRFVKMLEVSFLHTKCDPPAAPSG